MKKLLFALPFFALALTLTYCVKENNTKTVVEQIPATPVADRADCLVEVASDMIPVTVCGTGSNLTVCQQCPGGNGVGFSPAATEHAFYADDASTVFISITNTSTTDSAEGKVVILDGPTYCFKLQPGECRYIGIVNCTYFLSQVWDC